MADQTNRLVNLIINDVRTENLENTLNQFDQFQAKLGGLARSAVGKELGRDLKGVSDELLVQMGLYDRIKTKELELVDLAMKRAEAVRLEPWGGAQVRAGGKDVTGAPNPESVAILRELVAQRQLYGEVIQQEAAAVKNAQGAWSEYNRQAMENNRLLREQMELQKASLSVAAKEPEVIQASNVSRSASVRQYSELGEMSKSRVMQMVAEGRSLEEIGNAVKMYGGNLGQLKQFLRDTGIEVEKLTQSAGRQGGAWAENARQMRGLRYGGLEVMAMTSMLTMAFGDQMPTALRQFDKAAMLITSGGLAMSFMGLSPAIGIVAGAVLALGTTLMTVDEQTQELIKHMDQLAKKDEAQDALAKILGITKEEAQAMDELATKNREYARAIRDAVDAGRDMTGLEKVLRATQIGWQSAGDSIRDTTQSTDMLSNSLRGAQGAAGDFLNALIPGLSTARTLLDAMTKGMDSKRAADKQAALDAAAMAKAEQDVKDATEEANQEAKDGLKAWNDMARGMREADNAWTEAIGKADQTLAENLGRASQTLMDSNARALRSFTESIANADNQMRDALNNLAFQAQQQAEKDAEARRKIEQSLQDSSYKAWRSYNDKLQDAAYQRGEKITDLEKSYHKKLTELQDDQEKRAYDLAYKLYQIERDRIEALADLDFNTALDLSKAKTQNDKDEIEWRALHEREVINRRAGDQIADALDRAAQDAAEAAKKRRDLEIETAYRRTTIEREFGHELDTARRTYAEQLEDARRTYTEQLVAQKFNEQQQRESLQHQHDEIVLRNKEARDSAKQRYDNEIADSKKRYDQEIIDIHKRDNEARNSANVRYNDEITKVRERYDEEGRKIREAWSAWLTKHNLTMQALEQERQMVANVALAGSGGVEVGPGPSGGGSSGFGAGGLEMIVPPGYNNDSFTVHASSGERVSIQPAQNSATSMVNISVEPMLQPLVDGLLSKMINSNLFKEGVKIVVNDAVYQG